MNDWFSLKNSLKRGAKKLASQDIRIRKHITPTIFPDLIYILHVVPWLFFQEYLCTYIKNSPILDFLIKCKPTMKWILNFFGIPVYGHSTLLHFIGIFVRFISSFVFRFSSILATKLRKSAVTFRQRQYSWFFHFWSFWPKYEKRKM